MTQGAIGGNFSVFSRTKLGTIGESMAAITEFGNWVSESPRVTFSTRCTTKGVGFRSVTNFRSLQQFFPSISLALLSTYFPCALNFSFTSKERGTCRQSSEFCKSPESEKNKSIWKKKEYLIFCALIRK